MLRPPIGTKDRYDASQVVVCLDLIVVCFFNVLVIGWFSPDNIVHLRYVSEPVPTTVGQDRYVAYSLVRSEAIGNQWK